MKLGIFSDIHAHRKDQESDVQELIHHIHGHIHGASGLDLLIFAGDISHDPEEIRSVLSRIAPPCPRCWVPGNHDIWVIEDEEKPKTVDRTDTSDRRYHTLFPEISRETGWHYLPESNLSLPGHGIEVIGDIGWYTGDGYSEWFDGPYSEKDRQLARKFADNLEKRLTETPSDNIILVTHHVPDFRVLDPEKNNLAEGNRYIQEILPRFRDKITLAFHGHRHHRYGPRTIGGIRLVAHPFGYPRQHKSVSDGFRVLEI